ncbi:hypothetical protein MCAP1_001330 [Malassezia caprae]|uniref:Uncharacterized protein n=1 Tax=Malassezia caprae TaxID=1381934 RepID=A0AAF0E6G1_9BASI|nr:hypothetical protein MCAP1_001330 [Malassezia caprae]
MVEPADADTTWLGLCVGSGEVTEPSSLFQDPKNADATDEGWLSCRSKDPEQMHAMFAHILHFVRDVELRSVTAKFDEGDDGTRVLSDPLEECPDRADNPEYYEQIARPTSLQAITHRIVHCEYALPALFEQDMLQLFSNACQWYGLGTEGYGEMTTLQRLYNELTPSRGRLVDGSGTRHSKGRPSDIDLVSSQHAKAKAKALQKFASSPYGPGNEPPRPVKQPKILPMDAAAFKGRNYHVGDWVHIMNPVDPSRPIVGQIFRLYKRMDKPGTFFSACWYYRPEQTHHVSSRHFAENEVLQTGVYGEHAIEDVLGDALVLFHTTYQRARPAAAYWDKETPVYMVEFKYDVATHGFFPIHSWASCVPASVRGKVTPMDVFLQPAEPPARLASLLTKGIDVPGGLLLDDTDEERVSEDLPDLFEGAPLLGESTQSLNIPSRASAGVSPTIPPPAAVQTERLRAYAAFHAIASDLARRISPVAYKKLQNALASNPTASPVELGALALQLGGMSGPQVVHLRDAAVAAGMLPSQESDAKPLPTAAAVYVAHRSGASFKQLPPETRAYRYTDNAGELFRQDEHGQVLWHAALPLPGWPNATPVLDGVTPLPLPSLPYLERKALSRSLVP